MRITNVEAFPVFIPAPDPPFAWRTGLRGGHDGGTGGLLRIATDDGVEGLALCPRPGTDHAVKHLADAILREELIGRDPLDREYFWHRMWEIDRTEELASYVFSLVDVALWDLAGRAYGAPVWQLLGGYRTEIPAYASTATFATVEEYLDVGDQCLALGYRAIKLHAWGDARSDARLCQRLREHVGDQIELMYDGSAAFDLPDATYLGAALGEAGYLWYEEPMREFSVTSYRWLAERVSVPLMVAETSDGSHLNSADFIAAGAASYVRTGTELRGGFTGAMRIAHLADAYRLRAEPHGPTITSQHLCMAVANCTYYESLVLSNPVKRESCVQADGMVHAPAGPGVGLPSGLEYPANIAP